MKDLRQLAVSMSYRHKIIADDDLEYFTSAKQPKLVYKAALP